MSSPLSRIELKLLAKETEARKKLEKRLAEVTVKNAEAHNPGKKYRAVPIEVGPYTDYIPVLTGEKAWAYCYLTPHKNHKSWEGYKYILDEPKHYQNSIRIFEDLITKMKLIQGEKFKPRATAQELKKLKQGIEDLRWELHNTSTGLELEDLMQELVFAPHKLDRLIQQRQSKMKPSKYSDEMVRITYRLVTWWCSITGDESINAYSKGNAYDRSGVKDAVAKENLKNIDVKYNPGGAFIQRTLKTYFDLKLDNTQLKTLLNKARGFVEQT